MADTSSVKAGNMHRACEAFVKALIEADVIFDEEVGLVLDEEARKLGYMLYCRQMGIFGTKVHFGRIVD